MLQEFYVGDKTKNNSNQWRMSYMKCLSCYYYDKNDTNYAWGTCEPQDIDFHAIHECNLTDKEILEIEGLTGHKR